jgi:hypothetical protein
MRAYCIRPGDNIVLSQEEVEAELARQAASIVVQPPSGPTPSERAYEILKKSFEPG